MPTQSIETLIEEAVKKLFEIKDGFYPSGEATTARFSVKDIREALTTIATKSAEGCKNRR